MRRPESSPQPPARPPSERPGSPGPLPTTGGDPSTGGLRQRLLLAGLLSLTLLPGCVWHAPLSIRRLWFDFNTLGKPALVYEKTDRLPPRAFEVDGYRWMYNAGPGEQIPARQRDPRPIAAPRIWSMKDSVQAPMDGGHLPPAERGPQPADELPPQPEL